MSTATPDVPARRVADCDRVVEDLAYRYSATFTRHQVRAAVDAGRAALEPVSTVPDFLPVLVERGIEVSEEFPKPLTDDVVHAADVIVTMGCGDDCPYVPGKRYLDWDVADPDGQPIESVRAIRDDIQARVTQLLADVLDPQQ